MNIFKWLNDIFYVPPARQGWCTLIASYPNGKKEDFKIRVEEVKRIGNQVHVKLLHGSKGYSAEVLEHVLPYWTEDDTIRWDTTN